MTGMYVEVSFYINTDEYDTLIKELNGLDYEYDITDTQIEIDDEPEW